VAKEDDHEKSGHHFFYTLTKKETTLEKSFNYYPYGLTAMNWTRDGEVENRYSFQGKEYETKTQWHDFHARQYDAVLGRFKSMDPKNQFASGYVGMGNNPVMMVDPDGEFVFTALALIAAPFTGGASLALLPYTIGADVGMWQGGTMANGTANPFKWDYSSGKTWGYMGAGALVGAASGGAANAVATSGMVGANTAAIMTGSLINSVGTAMYTGGQTDVSVSFGFGSYNFSTGEFGYLGKKGNSVMQNIGYGLGALANVSDVLAGFKPGEVQLNTEKSDAIGHSALTKVGETDPHNSLVSVGPDPGGKWIFNPFKFKNGTNHWKNYVDAGDDVWKVGVEGINFQRITNYGANLNRGVNYNLYFSSCVNHTARALTLAGAPAIGIHPFILHSQMVLRSVGFRPMLYSYHLY
jgi:RHS repeat-associated protein